MQAKYDRIGNGYNNTRKADPYLTDKFWTLLDPKPNQMQDILAKCILS